MGSGPIFNWTQPPLDSSISPQMAQWATAVNSTINSLIGQVYPPVAPQVSAKGRNSSVLLSWNEVKGASIYQVYQSSSDTFAGSTLVGSVPSNQIGSLNSFLVSSLPDTNTRYFFVQPITGQGQPGTVSSGVAGAASSVPLPSGTTLDGIPDGTTYKKVTGVNSSNQITSPSVSSGTIETQHIVGGAVSANGMATSSQVNLVYATWTKIGSLSFTPNGGVVLIFFYGVLDDRDSNPVTVNVSAYKNGIDMGFVQPIVQVPYKAAGEYASYSFVVPDASPGTSANTYAIYAFLQVSSTLVYSANGIIDPINLKV